MDQATQQKLIKEESARFLDSQFGGLDLSGSPNLQQQATDDPFAAADKNGFGNVDFGQGNPLKAFTQTPDSESLDRVAKELGDTELASKIEDDRAEAAAKEFVRTHPNYYADPDYHNYNAIVEWLDAHQLAFTIQNLDAAFRALCREGRMLMKPGAPKALSTEEKLHVISLAKNGQIADALSTYLGYAFGDDAEQVWENETDFLSDPNTLAIRNTATRFVWFHSRPAVQDTNDWREFERSFFRGRPVRTINDYDVAFAEFQKAERTAFRERLIQPQNEQPENVAEALEDLDDSQIEKLNTQVRRHIARSSKR